MENEAVNLELFAAFIEENYTVEFEAVLLYSLYDIGANKQSIYALKAGNLRHILQTNTLLLIEILL